ncbi:MAG: hypothetical protein AB2989_03120 [Candidatus Symbiodolus clandestinus]
MSPESQASPSPKTHSISDYIKEEFTHHKPQSLIVKGSERWGARIGKQLPMIAIDTARLTLSVVKLPVAAMVKGYQAATRRPPSSCELLKSLEEHSLLQHLADIGIYTVALPYDALKGAVYLVEGGAEGLAFGFKGISYLLQQMTYHCCDNELEVPIRTPKSIHRTQSGPLPEIKITTPTS